jgi:tungstate transport system permease protein
MGYLWHELRAAIPLITNSDTGVLSITWVTLRLALISTGAALVIGLPIGVALGIGRFRGRRALHILANASLGVPPVLVGVFVLLLLLPPGALGSLQIEFTLKGIYVAQTLLALPYIVALTPAAIRGLPPGLLEQARALGAGRTQLAALALREAKIGVFAAAIAAFGAALSEVGAVVVVGGNIAGHDQTLASALLSQLNDFADYPYALALGIVLAALVLVLLTALTLLQQRTSGINLRFRTA